jgi:hypothetical protein
MNLQQRLAEMSKSRKEALLVSAGYADFEDGSDELYLDSELEYCVESGELDISDLEDK